MGRRRRRGNLLEVIKVASKGRRGKRKGGPPPSGARQQHLWEKAKGGSLQHAHSAIALQVVCVPCLAVSGGSRWEEGERAREE